MNAIIKTVKTAAEAKTLTDAGYTPVECAFGAESVVCELALDHHGSLAHLPPACTQAVKHAGKRSDDPRFVVTGAPDADAVLCIAIVSGAVDPAGLGDLVALVADRDVNPHVDMIAACEKNPAMAGLLWFLQQRWGGWNDALAGMIEVCKAVQSDPTRYLDTLNAEKARVTLAKDVQAAGRVVGDVLLVSVPAELGFGFDVWYKSHSFVVAYLEKWGSITVGATSEAEAARVGDGGLLDLFNDLEGAWGGRSTVGGSPRGEKMSFLNAAAVASVLSERI